jgi:hypothetical protein
LTAPPTSLSLSPPPGLGIVTIGTVGTPSLEGFTDELGDRTTAIGEPYKMGKHGHDERLRNSACDAHIQYLELDPATASSARLAAAATNIARESVRGYPNFQPPPIASLMPIATRLQAC